mmetsp:Transcript_63006/g.132977  ORF Transcript_63006/g.132977 Transcript_63006/m.132977 type:complete len:245 (-) Transcript_63006:555-1289(-)
MDRGALELDGSPTVKRSTSAGRHVKVRLVHQRLLQDQDCIFAIVVSEVGSDNRKALPIRPQLLVDWTSDASRVQGNDVLCVGLHSALQFVEHREKVDRLVDKLLKLLVGQAELPQLLAVKVQGCHLLADALFQIRRRPVPLLGLHVHRLASSSRCQKHEEGQTETKDDADGDGDWNNVPRWDKPRRHRTPSGRYRSRHHVQDRGSSSCSAPSQCALDPLQETVRPTVLPQHRLESLLFARTLLR